MFVMWDVGDVECWDMGVWDVECEMLVVCQDVRC